MKHNDWTDRLHDRLSDYKAVPPVGLWDKIETAVDGRRKRARTVRMRVWAAAAAVALLLYEHGVCNAYDLGHRIFNYA